MTIDDAIKLGARLQATWPRVMEWEPLPSHIDVNRGDFVHTIPQPIKLDMSPVTPSHPGAYELCRSKIEKYLYEDKFIYVVACPCNRGFYKLP